MLFAHHVPRRTRSRSKL